MDYNNFITISTSTFPKFINANGLPSNGSTITNACITKIANGGLGTGMVDSVFVTILTYNSSKARWECNFAINNFSSFYLHIINPNSIPLSIGIWDFKAEKIKETSLLSWKMIQEQNTAFL